MIAGLEPCSFIDFPGHLAAVLFTQGCNLRCRYCHNPDLCSATADKQIPLGSVYRFLEGRRDRLTGVVVTGGEPALHEALPDLLETVQSIGFAVKIDTNGTRKGAIERLVVKGLVDFVAVDVKVAPGSCSQWLCGVKHQAESALETLTGIIKAGVPCEARTTLVKGVHDAAALEAIACSLAAAGVRIWRLQPVRDGRVLDCSKPLVPPEPDILLRALNTARTLGIQIKGLTRESG